MIRKIFGNNLLRGMAVLWLSLFSITTTSFGFRQYIEGQDLLSWFAAIAVQILLVSGCFALTEEEMGIRKRIVAGLLYLTAVLISVSGSFLNFDNWICRQDRQARNADKVFAYVTDYKNKALGALDNRIAIVDKELARLKQIRKYEDEAGIASHRGSGKGPMYRTIATIEQAMNALKDRLQSSSVEIQACDTLQENGTFRRDSAKEIVSCVSNGISKVPTDQSISSELSLEYDLLTRTRYGEIYKLPEFQSDYPTMPSFDVQRAGSKEELFVGAIRDLRRGLPTSLIALFGAIIVDLLIFLIAVADSIMVKKNDNPNEKKLSNKSSKHFSANKVRGEWARAIKG